MATLGSVELQLETIIGAGAIQFLAHSVGRERGGYAGGVIRVFVELVADGGGTLSQMAGVLSSVAFF